MDITWHGDGCVRLRNRDTTVLIDPLEPGSAYPTRAIGDASIVLVSDDRGADGYPAGVPGSGKLIQGPGEYEIAGVLVTGVRTSKPVKRGGASGRRNVAYVVEMDEVRVCHLGRLDMVLSPDQVEELNGAEVLLVPVGGNGVLDAAAAAEVVSLLEPRIVVPVHYRTEASTNSLDPVDPFLKQMGTSAPQPQPRLSVTRTNLPLETSVTLLDFRR